MVKTNSELYNNRDFRYDDFLQTMQRDGIPARGYPDENWKIRFLDQWKRILNLRKY